MCQLKLLSLGGRVQAPAATAPSWRPHPPDRDAIDSCKPGALIHCQRTGIVRVGVETRPGVPRFSTLAALEALNVPTRGENARGPLKNPGNWKAEPEELSRGLRVVTGLRELQKWTGCMGLGRNSGVGMPWKAEIGCFPEGEMIDMWEVTGVRGEAVKELLPSDGTPRDIGLGFGLLEAAVTEEALGVRREEVVMAVLEL